MALEFDPQWEYWQPNEEIAEIFRASSHLSGFGCLGIDERRNEASNTLVGFRFGKGNPNRIPRFRLRRAKVTISRELEKKDCPQCGTRFQPVRSCRVFCSRECKVFYQTGRRRFELFEKQCPECHTTYQTDQWDQIYCSLPCANKCLRKQQRKCDYQEVEVRYVRGDKLTDIAKECGISLPSVKRIVKSLNVPRRLPGNHSRKVS